MKMRSSHGQPTERSPMKPSINVATLLMMLVSFSVAFAQPRFEVPLMVTDGSQTQILYFGILPGADFCIVPRDSINGHIEFFVPPLPPVGVFNARFMWPRGGPGGVCFDQGSPCDFRPFTSAAQRDTFMVRGQPGAGTTMIFSWPRGLSRYFSELTFCNTNMLTDTFAVCEGGRIISGGLITTGVGQSNGSTLPKEFILLQNYPNPFNPSTTIHYQLPFTSKVTIKLSNVLGQVVRTLVDGIEDAGLRSVKWNGISETGNHLAGGVYFYRIETSSVRDATKSFTQVKKMLLLR